jgi:NADPH:quinone reductase-like Zn-dependent oxidoreductase
MSFFPGKDPALGDARASDAIERVIVPRSDVQRSMLQTADVAEQHALLDKVAALVDAGKIRTTVAEHFGTINAANLKRAHALLETGKARGKIVLEGFA